MSTPRRKRPAKKPAVPAVASNRGALAADIRQPLADDIAGDNLAARAVRGNVSKALRVLKRAGVGTPPIAGDELPRKRRR